MNLTAAISTCTRTARSNSSGGGTRHGVQRGEAARRGSGDKTSARRDKLDACVHSTAAEVTPIPALCPEGAAWPSSAPEEDVTPCESSALEKSSSTSNFAAGWLAGKISVARKPIYCRNRLFE